MLQKHQQACEYTELIITTSPIVLTPKYNTLLRKKVLTIKPLSFYHLGIVGKCGCMGVIYSDNKKYPIFVTFQNSKINLK